MRTLYFECNMGAAGDMLMAALLELHENPSDFLERLNGVGLADVDVTAQPSVKCGLAGTHIRVLIRGREEQNHDHAHDHDHDHNHSHDHDHDHDHSHGHDHNHAHSHGHDYHHIEQLIGGLKISEGVKKDALSVYKLIAEAESHAHGIPINQIHFHEVGELDAVADIVGVCMLIEELSPDLILASPINVGSGQVRCAHGILPVPAPATAHILRNIPIYGDSGIKGELCTPTGAALLKYFVKKFIQMPVITVAGIGCGMGTKDFERANCVRAYIGETHGGDERVVELVCNLDDMTPEAVAFAQGLLMDKGALDVYVTPIIMKKGRAGVLFTCMCREDMKDMMVSLILKHTSTLGVREYYSRRYTLERTEEEVKTKYGVVRVKKASGFGVEKSKPEHADVAKIARERELSIREVTTEIERKCNEAAGLLL